MRASRALILADEPALLRLVGRLLEQSGYSVTTADPAATDLYALQRADPPFDVILVNSFLPEVSGNETTEQVQKFFPEAAIVNFDDSSHGPFNLDHLLRVVDETAGNGPPELPENGRVIRGDE